MIEYKGKWYARVSEVLEPFTDFGGIDKEVLKSKALLGTIVHKAIKDEIEGQFAVVSADKQGYMQSFHKWVSAVRCEFVESEVRYYCDEKRITGCIDALIKLEGEEKAILIDFKTSVQESPTWVMQAHLYQYLIKSMGKEVSDRFLFIKLDKSGKLPKIYQYKFQNNQMNRCLQAIDDWWKNKNVAINP